MKRWTSLGPEWKTADIFRIREILRDEHIPFKMPFYDVFFANTFNMPSEEKRWGILVREKDRKGHHPADPGRPGLPGPLGRFRRRTLPG